MEIKVHPSVYEDKGLQFHHEVGSALWIRNLEAITKIMAKLQTFINRRVWYILGVWWPIGS